MQRRGLGAPADCHRHTGHAALAVWPFVFQLMSSATGADDLAKDKERGRNLLKKISSVLLGPEIHDFSTLGTS